MELLSTMSFYLCNYVDIGGNYFVLGVNVYLFTVNGFSFVSYYYVNTFEKRYARLQVDDVTFFNLF